MPTNRTRRSRQLATRVITPDAIEAWQRGDWLGLHRSLNLRPWCPSPFDIDGYGGEVVPGDRQRVLELHRQLYEMAGEPGQVGNN